jgi:hypothetical protein
VLHHLAIDYVLEGARPGYTLHNADGLSDAVLKTVWRTAMPRGHGWGAPHLVVARSIKCFALPDGRAAVSHTVVTDQIDEQGRAGIRRAEIDVLPDSGVVDILKHFLRSYPEAVHADAHNKLSVGRWLTILNQALPRLLERNDQIILTYPYTSNASWQVIEYIVLHLATTWSIRALRGWPRVLSLTTLALDAHEESRIVAIPADAAQRLGLRAAIRLP